MTPFSHDVTPALAAHAALKTAYERRLLQAREGLDHWRTTSNTQFAALRRSVEATDDLVAAMPVVEHLTKNTTDLVLLGIGGSSLGAQTLAQLAFWGTPAYAPRVGGARLYIVDGLDGGVFRSRLQMSDLRTTRFLVVSKSGYTPEPQMQTLAPIEALEEARIQFLHRIPVRTPPKS